MTIKTNGAGAAMRALVLGAVSVASLLVALPASAKLTADNQTVANGVAAAAKAAADNAKKNGESAAQTESDVAVAIETAILRYGSLSDAMQAIETARNDVMLTVEWAYDGVPQAFDDVLRMTGSGELPGAGGSGGGGASGNLAGGSLSYSGGTFGGGGSAYRH